MFMTGQADLAQGEDDSNPVKLPQLESSTFELFVEHHFGLYTKEELQAFLAFCEQYECEQTKEFVINRIHASAWCFHSAELMDIATTYRIPSLFRTAFRSLANISLTELTKAHRVMIGLKTFASVALAKSVLDQHCRIIAAEEPHIHVHADDCQDTVACATDWHGVWWNGMGRYLLDGRNPQPYEDAVRRFKTEMQFGRMGKGCREKMFELLEEGSAFQHADHFIDDLCDYHINEL
ncbi:hypothetical protein EV363DRAFT_1185666 [Boletus edulis]|nr:hypothetical protein EV363DRAFT_1185666 [Boletus edulis]